MNFLLVAALAFGIALPAGAQAPAVLVGQPVAALVDDTAVAVLIRQASGGRQGIMARRLRNPGPALAQAEDGWVYGWTCAPPGCGHEDLFIAWHADVRRVMFMLVDEGAPTYSVPPRSSPWPLALQDPLAAFRAALGAR